MTMLRQDAEENSAPGHVLTLTSRDPIGAAAYREACAVFWRAFRRRWGRVEFCGFVEWTTGTAPRSGGVRRLHSHWLVKGLAVAAGDDSDANAVQEWASVAWTKLTGAWVVEFAELRSVGGVVGYLALHHEKMEQAPPAGWTGRRLRPSRGYFAESGRVRRERARLWLQERHWRLEGLDEGGMLARASRGAPRLVGALAEWEKDSRAAIAQGPGRSFDSLPARVALDEQLRRPDAPIHLDHLDALLEDAEHWRWRLAWRARAQRVGLGALRGGDASPSATARHASRAGVPRRGLPRGP